MKNSPTIWALTGNKAGTIAQALGLARQIAALTGGEVIHKTITSPALFAYLPSFCATFANLPTVTAEEKKPDILVGCGTKAQAALIALGKRFNALTIYIQRPNIAEDHFNAVVAPRHDYSESEIDKIEQDKTTNIVLTTGAVGAIQTETLIQRRESAKRRFTAYSRPHLAVLIGGDNRAYRLNTDAIISQIQSAAQVASGSLLITASRRSNADMQSTLQNTFADSHYVWDGGGDNPYLDILATADAVLVSEDSVNMISEACAGGKAVYLLPLTKKKGIRAQRAVKKFTRFHNDLIRQGRARLWAGELSFFTSPPLNESPRATHAVLQILQAWRKSL